MPSKSLSLNAGDIVAHGGEHWRILLIDSFERVLAERISDNRKDFLHVVKLSPPDWSKSNPDQAAELRDTKDDDVKRQSTYLSAIKRRTIRKLSPEARQDDQEKSDSEITLQEFKEGQKIRNATTRDKRQLIAAMAEKFGYSTSSVYRRLKIIELHGDPDALLRAQRNDKGKHRITGEVLELVDQYLAKYRFVETPKTLPAIAELVNGKCRELGYQEVSVASIKRIEERTSLKARLKSQGRNEQVRNQFRPKVGHLPGNNFPLAIIQVDHTPCQICFVDEIDRLPIGDAWLTIVIDTYSRMILGYNVSFEAPSVLSTGLALAQAFLPKEQILLDLGIKGEWPCWGFPDIVHVDNAAELNGRMMHGARRRYRFNLRNRPVGSPNFGGHVESAFRTFMFEIKSVPGTKFSNPTERAEYDSEGKAVMTLAEFDKYFAEFIVNDYHLAEHSGDGMNRMSPLQRWNKGVHQGDIMPPTGLPDRPTDSLALRLSLMPFEMRTIRNGIVEILGERYHSGSLTLIGDKIDLTKSLAARKFEVRYDPRNISRVWVSNSVQYLPD
ncbi:Mu transposase C-terminal domain-containing protein [Undibacterium sp. RTI2.1]|uniref:Mu transposase C-terminal domain-containing protein n=1 Tax=unclassified Undibacterium TaxID=2630295 RepID=UPI002B234C38|nr:MULTISPECIES: Mu transposase C-terminal domain-containing protein [unclassified Undibacterium]MEB0029690.1 Mu transposase C-terminal domain-containing protein [Undibacterium sp. RTI2.1]MEB0116161.1 Mu transposase C-terminal domain-containing protein [Undibacterium sp. RTI2.2]